MLAGRLTLLNIIVLHLLLNVVVLIATLISLSRAGISLSFGVDGSLAKRMLKYGAKIQVGGITGMANMSLDQVLMAAWLPPDRLGLYVVAVSAAGLAQVFSQAVQMVLTPSITQKESLAERAAVLQGVFRRYWLLSFLVTLRHSRDASAGDSSGLRLELQRSHMACRSVAARHLFHRSKRGVGGRGTGAWRSLARQQGPTRRALVTIALLYLLLPRSALWARPLRRRRLTGRNWWLSLMACGKITAFRSGRLFSFKTSDLLSALNILELIKLKRERLAPDQN